MDRKSWRSIIFTVGAARHFSKSFGPNERAKLGRLVPGRVEARHWLSLSPIPTRHTQLGGLSKRVMKDDTKPRIFFGISTPRGPVPRQRLCRTLPLQKETITRSLVGVLSRDSE